ncbi:MAG: hypothetical protein D6772_09515 [Bacteroidetes bacterium]|nr:MAG: hypothetical protein D6772_09515 [Bacteroidota bacterium]
MKLKLSLLALLSALLIYSCGEDGDPTTDFPEPTVTAPSVIINIEAGSGDHTVDFAVAVANGLTATYTATATGVSLISSASGNVTGNTVTISYTAPATPGAASITLTVTDSEGQTAQATAVISVLDEVNEVTIVSNITSDATWTADNTYILGGRITVVDGVTLTIEPGTVIKGQAGAGANATALLIARGGKLIAEGTAEAPIIFTSVADEITPEQVASGNFSSPNLDPTINGLWGGVLILGKAPISASNEGTDVVEVQIEGIPTSDANGLYGGNDPADNSGSIRYVSIRHGGTNIGAGNEINGLTLGGVGSGTTIENIEVVANQDDGIEWFGGTVDVNNVLVWNVGDDGIDTDQAWSGTLDNFVVVTPTGHCFELDGPEGSAQAGHTIQNGTIVAGSDSRVAEDLINVDDNSIVDLKRLQFLGVVAGQRINRVTAAGVTFEDITIDVAPEDLASYVNGDVPAGVTAGRNLRADVSKLSWTWAAQTGALEGL